MPEELDINFRKIIYMKTLPELIKDFVQYNSGLKMIDLVELVMKTSVYGDIQEAVKELLDKKELVAINYTIPGQLPKVFLLPSDTTV